MSAWPASTASTGGALNAGPPEAPPAPVPPLGPVTSPALPAADDHQNPPNMSPAPIRIARNVGKRRLADVDTTSLYAKRGTTPPSSPGWESERKAASSIGQDTGSRVRVAA